MRQPGTDWREHVAPDEAQHHARVAAVIAAVQRSRAGRFGNGRALRSRRGPRGCAEGSDGRGARAREACVGSSRRGVFEPAIATAQSVAKGERLSRGRGLRSLHHARSGRTRLEAARKGAPNGCPGFERGSGRPERDPEGANLRPVRYHTGVSSGKIIGRKPRKGRRIGTDSWFGGKGRSGASGEVVRSGWPH